jgi:hypothetical protein
LLQLLPVVDTEKIKPSSIRIMGVFGGGRMLPRVGLVVGKMQGGVT